MALFKERYLLFALLGPTEYFWTKADAVHFVKWQQLIDEMYNFKETNTSTTIEYSVFTEAK